MRTATDALRSLRRFVAMTLANDTVDISGTPVEWEIRYWSTDGENRFPFAKVAATTPLNADGGAWQRDVTQTFAIHLYPRPQTDPETAAMEAARIEQILFQAFEVDGTYTDKPSSDPATWTKVIARARRVPLYDYAGVPLDGPTSETFARNPNDYMRVLACPISRMDDPQDDRYTLVVVEPRLTWRHSGYLPSGMHTVQQVKVGGWTPT